VSKLELLSQQHDRDGFDCGSEPLNLFLKQTARQHGARGISRTFVLVAKDGVPSEPVLGYFSLNLCPLQSERLPPEEAKRFPKVASGVRLGRLAVDLPSQRQGLGKMLLIAAMRRLMEIFKTAGDIGLFVDAKDDSAKRYYEQFGFVPMPSNPLELFLPVRVIEETLRRA
jgi:ribosomal protein S18 acetylase RimI-like enzyme